MTDIAHTVGAGKLTVVVEVTVSAVRLRQEQACEMTAAPKFVHSVGVGTGVATLRLARMTDVVTVSTEVDVTVADSVVV